MDTYDLRLTTSGCIKKHKIFPTLATTNSRIPDGWTIRDSLSRIRLNRDKDRSENGWIPRPGLTNYIKLLQRRKFLSHLWGQKSWADQHTFTIYQNSKFICVAMMLVFGLSAAQQGPKCFCSLTVWSTGFKISTRSKLTFRQPYKSSLSLESLINLRNICVQFSCKMLQSFYFKAV